MTPSLPVIDINPDFVMTNSIAMPKHYKIGFDQATTSSSLLRGYNNRLNSSKNIVVFQQLSNFSKVKDNWDNNNAKAIDIETINAAKRFTEDLDRVGIDTFFCTYGAEGEILMEIKNEDRAVEFYFYPNQNQDFAAFDKNTLVKEEILDSSEFRKVIQWFRYGKWI
jgi:hypothetical protein